MEILLTAFVSIVLIIIFFLATVAWIATRVSDAKSKKKMSEIYEASPYREKKKPHAKPSDEFRARDERKEFVTGKSPSQEFVKLQEREQELQEEGLVALQPRKTNSLQKEDTVIVGLAKPVGFWSRLVMSQKLGFLMNLSTQMKQGKEGYFVNLIRAQARSQGKEKGRGM